MSNNFEEDKNKKKILDEQETDLKADRESSQPLLLTDELKAEGIEMISYSKYLYIEHCKGYYVHINLFKDSISRTLEYFDSLVNGSFNDSLKKSIKLFIAQTWEDIRTRSKSKSRSKAKSRSSDDGDDEIGNSQGQGKITKAQLIIPVVKPHLNKLFTDEYGIPHAGIQVDDHIEVLKLNATRFKNWVRRTTYKEDGVVIDTSTLNDIIGILSAEAEFNPECPTVNLALRVANIDDSWYYDLTNKQWEFIQITPQGWYKVRNAIIFHRYQTTPQVDPIRDYSPDIFDRFINLFNIQGDKNRLLLKCYIISLFIPGIPKVILNLHGEEGAAKTTLQELIKMLVDPNPMKTQIVVPYPPFGIATVTVLNIAAYLMLLGIYNSAAQVSANNNLRKFIHKHALKLLNPIGEAELQKEIQIAVKKISEKKQIADLTTETSLELDEKQLEKYLNEVIKIKKEHKK